MSLWQFLQPVQSSAGKPNVRWRCSSTSLPTCGAIGPTVHIKPAQQKEYCFLTTAGSTSDSKSIELKLLHMIASKISLHTWRCSEASQNVLFSKSKSAFADFFTAVKADNKQTRSAVSHVLSDRLRSSLRGLHASLPFSPRSSGAILNAHVVL